MKVRRTSTGVPEIQDPKILESVIVLDRQMDDVVRALTGNVAFGPLDVTPAGGVTEGGGKLENIAGVWIVHSFGAAVNTDETVPHKLGRVPVGLINVERPSFTLVAPVNGRVYFGSVAPTPFAVTLRCDAASKVGTVILF